MKKMMAKKTVKKTKGRPSTVKKSIRKMAYQLTPFPAEIMYVTRAEFEAVKADIEVLRAAILTMTLPNVDEPVPVPVPVGEEPVPASGVSGFLEPVPPAV